jgi:DNA-binding LacI/PurR family transcriptional regulator
MTEQLPMASAGLPKYQAVAQHFEQAIAGGRLRVGDRLPSERELASQWEVTPMTVRQALDVLRRKQLIVRRQGQGTFVAAGATALVPPPVARREVYLLGMTPSRSEVQRRVNWQPRLRRFQGLVDAAFRHGVVLHSSLELAPDSSAAHLVEVLRQASGVILHDEVLPESVLAGLAEAGVPLVAINCYPLVDYCSRLLIDSRRAAFAAVRHLAELGHTRIGLIVGDPSRYSMGLRLAGYRDAHTLLNLPLRPEYTVIEPRGFEQDAVAACRQLLALPEPPTALFVASDRRALGLLDAAPELGLSIPRDLSLVGFDDLAEAAASTPPLTTLHNPLYESGEQAVALLLRLLNRDVPPGTVTMLPAPLVERGTTAPLTPLP